MPHPLRDPARALLRANDRGGLTIPSPRLYPHQWAWDSAFAAIGWATFDPARALREIEVLLAGQWDDGRVPHIQFAKAAPAYFPGPDTWGPERSTSVTNPPVWTMAARRLLDAGCDRDALRALLPAIDRSHQFFYAARDPLGWGGVATVHPWESGLDNSPAWDEPMQAVDPERAPPFERVDTKVVSDASQRPTDDDYKRYIVLVRDIAEAGFGPGPFAVYDPLMTTLLAWAERDLAALGEALGVETEAAARAERAEACLRDRLWSGELGRYRFRDVPGDRWLEPDVLAAYLPLVIDEPGPRRDAALAGLREGYLSATWPLPSANPKAPFFDARRYWRGPSWVNMNWLFCQAPELADALAARTLELVERSGFREYYHPETGEGLGAEDFTWTAALVLDLLNR